MTENTNKLTATLLEGDCLERMKEIAPKSVDLILCDLPYGTTNNKWDSVIPLAELWAQYDRVLKPNGVTILTGHGVFTAALIFSNIKKFKYKIVWEKSKPTNFLNAKRQPLRKYEDICVFYSGQPTYNPQMSEGLPYNKGKRKNQLTGSYNEFASTEVKSSGGRYPTDIVYFATAESEGPVWHPTQKPVALARYLVRTFTNPGDMVLDNAFGSGSFLVGAATEGRNCMGIEKNEETAQFKSDKNLDLIEIASKRISEICNASVESIRSSNRDQLSITAKSKIRMSPSHRYAA